MFTIFLFTKILIAFSSNTSFKTPTALKDTTHSQSEMKYLSLKELHSTLHREVPEWRDILTVNSLNFYFLIKNTRGTFQAQTEEEWDV